LWLSGGSSSHDLDPDWSITNLHYIVRAATLFRLLGSSGDTDGSLKSGEQRFIRPHVARPKVS
jgi:hypothetical protein